MSDRQDGGFLERSRSNKSTHIGEILIKSDLVLSVTIPREVKTI